jgi:hypothetical protein
MLVHHSLHSSQVCASCESLLPSYGTILLPTVDHTVHTAPYGTYCYGSRIFGHFTTVAKGLTHDSNVEI